jgi:hypothetical protein
LETFVTVWTGKPWELFTTMETELTPATGMPALLAYLRPILPPLLLLEKNTVVGPVLLPTKPQPQVANLLLEVE